MNYKKKIYRFNLNVSLAVILTSLMVQSSNAADSWARVWEMSQEIKTPCSSSQSEEEEVVIPSRVPHGYNERLFEEFWEEEAVPVNSLWQEQDEVQDESKEEIKEELQDEKFEATANDYPDANYAHNAPYLRHASVVYSHPQPPFPQPNFYGVPGHNVPLQQGGYPGFPTMPHYSNTPYPHPTPFYPTVAWYNPVITIHNNFYPGNGIPMAAKIQDFSAQPFEVTGDEHGQKRKYEDRVDEIKENFEQSKRRKIIAPSRSRPPITAHQFFEELSQCYFKINHNYTEAITLHTKQCAWDFVLSDFEDVVFKSISEENRGFLNSLKKYCLSRKCKEKTIRRDLRKIYVQALNDRIFHKPTLELQEFMKANYKSIAEKYRQFNKKFSKNLKPQNFAPFAISPWSPILSILQTTSWENGENIRVDKLAFKESLLHAFESGRHLNFHRFLLNAWFALNQELVGDVATMITTRMVWLYMIDETYVFDGFRLLANTNNRIG